MNTANQNDKSLVLILGMRWISCRTFNTKEMTDQEKATKILFYLLAFTIAMFALSVLALLYVYAHPTITLK